ncbi:MAG: murein L,D-transpeptidase family protein [Acidobacteriota bacterium]
MPWLATFSRPPRRRRSAKVDRLCRLGQPAALVLLVALAGCTQLPEREWKDLQAARRELRLQGLPTYLPERYSEFEAAFAMTQRRFAVESNTVAFFRHTDKLIQEVQERLAKARLLLQEGIAEKARLRQMEQQAIEQLEENTRAWSRGTLDPAQRRLIARLQIQTANAKAFWQQGEFLKVRELLERVDEEAAAFESRLEGLKERYRNPREQRRWQIWALKTIEWSRHHKKAALLVDKYNRRALLFDSGSLVERFAVDLGWNRFPDKHEGGDGATPEGRYRVVQKKSGGQTLYFQALLLDYPNAADRRDFALAKRRGEIRRRARLGALIEIHGEGGRGKDWTQGCVALSNSDMEKLFRLAYVGMPVTIVGQAGTVAEATR